ncbi:MAG: hypothetical protein NC212_01020 [Staphylococcus sp.]|nr:hypothetical protein [Staphylococcus sp.]
MKQKNTHGDTRRKNCRPVSEKFYQSLNDRAIAAANVTGHPLLGVDVMMAVDAYINEGIQPTGRNVELLLIFTLLKPEIDKALVRSAAARSRRKRQCAAKATVAETKCSAPESSGENTTEKSNVEVTPEPGQPTSTNAFTSNRRERRRLEQEQRRRERRRLVPLSGKPVKTFSRK